MITVEIIVVKQKAKEGTMAAKKKAKKKVAKKKVAKKKKR